MTLVATLFLHPSTKVAACKDFVIDSMLTLSAPMPLKQTQTTSAMEALSRTRRPSFPLILVVVLSTVLAERHRNRPMPLATILQTERQAPLLL
jgi:hypothetical protein